MKKKRLPFREFAENRTTPLFPTHPLAVGYLTSKKL